MENVSHSFFDVRSELVTFGRGAYIVLLPILRETFTSKGAENIL